MDEEWDADSFQPKVPTTLTASNKWEGEDEEEEVKESWEDDEEEKKDEEKKEMKEILPPQKVKPKKSLLEKIAEKERSQREELERKQAEIEEQMTPEEKMEEKLRRQKLQEESDLRVAMETFGITDGSGGRLDSFQPTTKAEFDEFADLLSKKITLYKQRDEFPAFIEELVRNLTAHLNSLDLKRLKLTIDNMYMEKQKVEKGDKAKKPTKGKAKAKLRVEGDNDFTNFSEFKDDYDDFM